MSLHATADSQRTGQFVDVFRLSTSEVAISTQVTAY